MEGRKVLHLATCVLALGVMAACPPKAPGPGPGAIYRKALYSKVSTLDPAKLTDTASLAVANQIYDGLLEFDSHFELRPALAESWTRSPDGLTLTFKLRDGLRFHDGVPVTSADCLRSFERLLGPGSLVSNYYDLIEGAQEFRQGKAKTVRGLTAPDARTFAIRLKSPFPPFSMVLAGATARVLPKHLVDRPGFFERPIGTGAFRLVSQNEREIVLSRFEAGYWREPARLSELRFLVLNEAEALDQAARGEVQDLVGYPLNGDEAVFSLGQHMSVPVVATWLIGMNSRLKPFTDVRARRAFRGAISARDFTDRFYPGQDAAMGGYIPPGLPGHLAEALEPGESALPKEPVTLVIPKELARANSMARYFEERLRKAGFKIKAEIVPWAEFVARYNNKSMQAFLFSMNADYPDTEFLARNFESDNPDNFSGARSPKIDALVQKARETYARDDRARIYVELAHELNREAFTVNLMHYRAHIWFSRCVEGVELNSLGDVYIPYRTLSLKDGCAKDTSKAEVARAER